MPLKGPDILPEKIPRSPTRGRSPLCEKHRGPSARSNRAVQRIQTTTSDSFFFLLDARRLDAGDDGRMRSARADVAARIIVLWLRPLLYVYKCLSESIVLLYVYIDLQL